MGLEHTPCPRLAYRVGGFCSHQFKRHTYYSALPTCHTTEVINCHQKPMWHYIGYPPLGGGLLGEVRSSGTLTAITVILRKDGFIRSIQPQGGLNKMARVLKALVKTLGGHGKNPVKRINLMSHQDCNWSTLLPKGSN
jgi:hypothetical protein